MNYGTIMSKVEEAYPDHWVRVDVTPGVSEHHSLAVRIEDVGISIAWGAEHNEGEVWHVQPWSENFPDSNVRGFYADVRWHGQPIHRELLMSVDGGRAYLPAGSPIGEEGKGIVGMTATPKEIAVARLVHDLVHNGDDFDDYMKRANITPA